MNFKIYDKKEKRYLKNDENCEYVVDMNGVLYNTNPCWNCETDLDDYRLEEMDKRRYVIELELEDEDKIRFFKK